MTNATIHTDPQLLEQLREAAKEELTAEERHRQRVSLAMSVIDEDDSATRERVEKAVAAAYLGADAL